jgi:NDP-sugar pyrophosphorylase family protein
MQVVILAGGMAARLGKLTRKTPKSMVRIQGRPFLEYQLSFLERSGVKDIVLCVGHLAEQIEEYFRDGGKFRVSIKYSYERERLLGTAGALKNAEQLLDRMFFTIYGDSYPFLDFADVLSYFQGHNKLALMTVYKNYDKYDRSNTVVEGNLVKKYNKKEKPGEMIYIDYGVNLFRKEALSLIPKNQPCSLEELFTKLIAQEELLAYEVKRRFYQIGSLEGLAEFERYMSRVGIAP